MGRQRQPIELIIAKGKKHLTKGDIEERLSTEPEAPSDAVCPPRYLTAGQKRKFTQIAKMLLDIGIISNLDCDTLGRYLQSEEKYRKYDQLVSKGLREAKTFEDAAGLVVLLEKFEGLRDKAFKQCRAAASDLGLTISSRCKLVVPKKEEEPMSKWEEYKEVNSG